MDFLAVATHLAQAHAAQLTASESGQQTHWNTYDAPRYGRREQMAACGEVVSLKAFSVVPTCPACRQQLAMFDSLQF